MLINRLMICLNILFHKKKIRIIIEKKKETTDKKAIHLYLKHYIWKSIVWFNYFINTIFFYDFTESSLNRIILVHTRCENVHLVILQLSNGEESISVWKLLSLFSTWNLEFAYKFSKKYCMYIVQSNLGGLS